MLPTTEVNSLMETLVEHLKLVKKGQEDFEDGAKHTPLDFLMPTVSQVFGAGATKSGQTLAEFLRRKAKSSCMKIETDKAAHYLLDEGVQKLYRPMKADGRDGSCAYVAVCQSLTGTGEYAVHLRLIAAVFCAKRGWNGVHATTRGYFAAQQVGDYGLPATTDLAIEIAGGECADLQALAMLGGVLDISILHLHPGGISARGLENVASWAEVGQCNLDDFTAAEARLQNVYFVAPTGGSKKNPLRLMKSLYKGKVKTFASDIPAVEYAHYSALVGVPKTTSSWKHRGKNSKARSGACAGAGDEDIISKWCEMAKAGDLPGTILPSIAGIFSSSSEKVQVISSCGKADRPAVTTTMLSDNHPQTGKNIQAEKETAGENVATPAPPPGDAENPVNETRVGISAREGFAVGVEDASAGVSAESVMKPFVGPIVKSVVKPVVDPVAGTVVRPIVDTVVEPVVGPIVELVVDRAVESAIERVAESVVKPVVEPVIEPAVHPVVEPVDEPVADAVTKTATMSDDAADNGLPAPITGVKTVSAVVRPIDDSVAEGVVGSVAEGPVPGEELGVGVADDGWMGGWFGGVISHVRDVVEIAANSSIVQAALDVTEAAIGTSSPVSSAVEGIPEPAKGSARVAAVAGAVFNTVVDWTGHRVEEAVLLVHHAADFSVCSMRTLWAFLAVCCARIECYVGVYFLSSLFREFVLWFELFA